MKERTYQIVLDGIVITVTKKRIKNMYLRIKKEDGMEKLIQKYEQLMRVQVSGVTIRQMKTRWGSCNVKTHHININLALYEKGPECLEYVVVHEMCHILEASHNKIFWGYVAQYFPDWKNVRARLNEEGV